MVKHRLMLRALPLLIIMLLLSSTLALTQFGGFALGNMMFPEQAPRGVTITSGGTVEGTDQIQVSGNTFTLTGNIEHSITVLRDGIVLDGASYTLHGSGYGVGVFLQERNQVTIKNLKIEGFDYGIKFTWLSYSEGKPGKTVTITGNTITGNDYGIAFLQHLSGEISNNYFADNTYAVYSPDGVTFKGNQFRNNDYCIYDEFYGVHNSNDVDVSNTVNGKPIYYWVNQQDQTVPSNAGLVVLKNCTNITVQGLSIDEAGGGLLLYQTSKSTISGNVIAHSTYGITLQSSNENTISSNQISGGKEQGIYVAYSNNNNVLKNQVTANSKDGILIEYSYNNIVTENRLVGNGEVGIVIRAYQDSGNGVTTLTQNDISKNGMGILVENTILNTIILNNITENCGFGIKLNGTQRDNTIHHNNFINNNVTNQLQVCISGFWNYSLPHLATNSSHLVTNSPAPFTRSEIKFVPGSANFWDNGMEGNYWSDYTIIYRNATRAGTSAAGDTPFYINENNMDHYPLMLPVDISNADSAIPTQPSAQDSEAQQNAFPNTTIIVISIVSLGLVSAGLVLYFKNRSKRSSSAN